MTRHAWDISGAKGETIRGICHEPTLEGGGAARGVMLIAHGFKGYRDYGMFPYLAAEMARAGLIAHRFNFSHSGMTDAIDTFARPDLFERDTWNRQVEDLRAIIDALAAGTIAGRGVPLVLFGHSRGGVAVLLTAGRGAGAIDPAAVITAAAPSRCNTLSDADAERLRTEGSIESPSSRTGQLLRVGRAFLQEQLDDPAGHDLVRLVGRIKAPVMIVHGDEDPTVPVDHAERLATAIGDRATVRIVAGANHVFNTPNPMDDDDAPSPQLAALRDAMRAAVDAALS